MFDERAAIVAAMEEVRTESARMREPLLKLVVQLHRHEIHEVEAWRIKAACDRVEAAEDELAIACLALVDAVNGTKPA